MLADSLSGKKIFVEATSASKLSRDKMFSAGLQDGTFSNQKYRFG
jgi:hypothetical protein